jgi:spermidine synthase/tetratricopeptide (TPR) repeat protein
VAAAAIVPATILMGATLPVLARSRAGTAPAAGRAAGRLGGINALGGALGAILALALLPLLGRRATLLAAAAGHLAAAGAAWHLGRRHAGGPPRESAATLPGTHTPLPALVLMAAGAGALSAQIAWTRAFSWLLGSTVYTFGLVLAAIIGGYGIGGWLGARPAAASRSPTRLFAALQAAAAAGIALSLALLAGHPARVAALAAAFAHRPFAFQAAGLALVAATVTPAAACLGAAFPAACRLRAARAGVGRGIGHAAGWITAGNVAGALAAGFLLPAWIGTRGVLLLAAGLPAAVALATWPGPRLHPARPAAAAAAMLLAWLLPSWQPGLMAADPAGHGPAYAAAARATGGTLAEVMASRGRLTFAAESGDGLVTVRALPGGHASLQINGRTEASTAGDLPAQILAAQLPLLHAVRDPDVLVVGLASGVTAGSALSHDPRLVVVAEMAPTVVTAARSGPFDEASRRPWDDPRVRILAVDARALLRQSAARYDVIASQPSNPWVPGVAGLYTAEFYDLVRRRLRPAGVFGQWVQGYGLTLGDLQRVCRTFASRFPHVALYEEAFGGGDYFLLGSDRPLSPKPAALAARLTPAVLRELSRAGIDGPADLVARRVADRDALIAFAGDGPLETDDRLRLPWSTPLSRGRQTTSTQARALEPWRTSPLEGLDLSGLPPAEARDLRRRLQAAETRRREEREFLALLDDEALDQLATPLLGEAVGLARAGLPRAAYGLLLAALESEPGGAVLQILAGDLALRLGERELAALHYRTALELRPDAVAAHAGLGALLLESGDAGTARAHLEAAAAGRPAAPRVWSNLGVARRRTGEPDAAETAYRRALELDPALSEAWYNLGVLLAAGGRRAEAAVAYRRSLAAAPADCDAWRGLQALGEPTPDAAAAACDQAASPTDGAARARPAAPAPPAPRGSAR